jgi:hypothetical protein
VGATFLRPLLRDANFKQEIEALTQTDRQLLYDLRNFTQFRKDFSVQTATAYYGVLGLRDAVRNNFLNLQSSRKNAERTRALAQEGRLPKPILAVSNNRNSPPRAPGSIPSAVTSRRSTISKSSSA